MSMSMSTPVGTRRAWRRDRRTERRDRDAGTCTWQRFDAHAVRAQAPRWW